MNPYVYKRRGSRLAKKSHGLQSLVTLIKEVTFTPVSSMVAFAALAFGAVSIITIIFTSQVEITNLTAQPEVRYGVKGEVKSLSLQQRSAVKEMVLGEAVYIKTLLTSSWNTSMKIYAQPIGYLSGSGKWVYEISWNRTKNAVGSLYVDGRPLEQTAAQIGAEKVEVLPRSKVKVEFYSQPGQKGTLLVRKFFIAKDKLADESAVCPGVANCPAPALGYHYEKTGSECGCGVMVKDSETDKKDASVDVSFRYLKLENVVPTEWAAWRELEFYDASGVKLKPTVAGGSSDWNPQTPKDPTWTGPITSAEIAVGNNAGGKAAAIDGNSYTQWNSAAKGWVPNFSAPTYIILDFGKNVTLSKIRLHTQGEGKRDVNIWVGDSPTSQKTLLKNITGTYADFFWIETTIVSDTSKAPETDKKDASTDTSFRYLKVDVKDSQSWVALMEVEVYGVDGKKITTPNTKVVASHDWANYPGKKDPYVGLPNAIVDGDYGTGWNAGETTVGCNWYGTAWADRAPCIGGLRSAWIQLDLGEKKDVSKIKMLPINFPNPAFATYNLLISDNGVDWRELSKIKTKEKTDHVWMVYEKNSGIVLQND